MSKEWDDTYEAAKIAHARAAPQMEKQGKYFLVCCELILALEAQAMKVWNLGEYADEDAVDELMNFSKKFLEPIFRRHNFTLTDDQYEMLHGYLDTAIIFQGGVSACDVWKFGHHFYHMLEEGQEPNTMH